MPKFTVVYRDNRDNHSYEVVESVSAVCAANQIVRRHQKWKQMVTIVAVVDGDPKVLTDMEEVAYPWRKRTSTS